MTRTSNSRNGAAPRLGRLGAIVLVLVAAGAAHASAADGVSIALSPSRLIFAAEPGSTMATPVTIYNQGDAPLDLTIGVGDFLLDDSGGAASTFAVADWVRTNVSTLRLDGHAQAEVRVIVDVPVDAAPGGYQAGLYVVSAPSGGGPVTVSGRLGAAVLIELAPDGRPLRREIQVAGHQLVAEFPDEFSLNALFGPVGRTETLVRNVGETYVRAVGADRYRTWLADGAVERQAPGRSILRASEGSFSTTHDAIPWIGPVSVTTEIVYERGAQDYATILVQADTFVVPWRLLGLLAVVGGLVSTAFLWRRRSPRAAAGTPSSGAGT